MPETPVLTAYDILSVHPTAPSDLVSASYWWHAGELQRLRSEGYEVDAALYGLTRAYGMVSDPRSRPAYNEAIGFHEEPLTKRPLKQKRMPIMRRLILRQKQTVDVDYYEVLGLAPSAPEAIIAEAARVMRDQYLRLPRGTKHRRDLLQLVNEAISVLLNEEERARYDAALARRRGAARNGMEPAQALADTTAVAEPAVEEPPVEEAAIDEPATARPEVPEAAVEEMAVAPPLEAVPEVATTQAEVAPVAEAVEPVVQPEEAAPEIETAEPLKAPRGRKVRAQQPAAPMAEDVTAPGEAFAATADQRIPAEVAPTTAPAEVERRPSTLGPALVAVARGVGAGIKGAGVLLARGVSSATRGIQKLRSTRKKDTKASPPMWPAPTSDPQPMFQRPLRRGVTEVEEAFLGRLASSVKEARLPAAPQADQIKRSPES